MTLILFLSTALLTLTAVVFAVIYLVINMKGTLSDLVARNNSILSITRASMILSLVFALLSGLLSGTDWVQEAVAVSGFLYTVIAVAWLVVLLVCGVVMMVSLVSRSLFRPAFSLAVRKMFLIALPGAGVALLFSYLLS